MFPLDNTAVNSMQVTLACVGTGSRVGGSGHDILERVGLQDPAGPLMLQLWDSSLKSQQRPSVSPYMKCVFFQGNLL